MPIVFAQTTAAVATADGVPVTVREGEAWDAADPLVKRYPGMFADGPVKVRRSVADVETAATDAGGRRRRG